MKPKQGFTLIELLIVIGIILILAGIGIYEYQVASIKSKVSRVKADLQTIALALESYNTDNNQYPFNENCSKAVWRLTTPIAYMTTYPNDVFGYNSDNTVGNDLGYQKPTDHYYWYYRWHDPYIPITSDTYSPPSDPLWASDWFGMWLLSSYGPDNVWSQDAYTYDPSNGITSNGDIMRRQLDRYKN